MSTSTKRCHICGKPMKEFKGVYMCLPCNEKYGQYYNYFKSATEEYQKQGDWVVIECPGATIYDETNTRVVAGVKFNNSRDPSQGYEIVGRPIYAPNHQKIRRVKRDHVNNISRCQACQDFTVRMRIYNQQKDQVHYEQNSPLMPKNREAFRPPQF